MFTIDRIKGLYAITPDIADTVLLLSYVRLALEGGASAIQYRNKTANASLKKEQAPALLQLCRQYSAWLIINDDVILANLIDASGVHLGKNDCSIEAARAQLGPKKIIGLSCYAQLNTAHNAQQRGANYVAFGSVYPSPTKPLASRAPLALFSEAKQTLQISLVAIGGITTNNVSALIQAGADAVAVSSGLFNVPDIKDAAIRINKIIALNSHVEQSTTI